MRRVSSPPAPPSPISPQQSLMSPCRGGVARVLKVMFAKPILVPCLRFMRQRQAAMLPAHVPPKADFQSKCSPGETTRGAEQPAPRVSTWSQ